MKIGIILSRVPFFSETFFITKIKGLQKNNFEVVLFTESNCEEFNLCEVRSNFVASKKYFSLAYEVLKLFFLKPKLIVRFYRLERIQKIPTLIIIKKILLNHHILNENNVDWFHFGFCTKSIGRENIAPAMNVKFAVSIRGFDIGVYPIKFPNCYNLLWQKVNKVHVISDDLLRKAYKTGLNKNTPVKKITPAIDINLFKSKPKKFDTNQIKILTVGRLNWKKDYESILLALNTLKNNGFNYQYFIIGSGPEEERLRFLVYELGLSECVFFKGTLTHNQILKYYEDCNYYIQYSLQEGFCNAVLESQSMGLLTIASDAEGLSENIINNVTGWIVKKNNHKLLAEKLIDIFKLSMKTKNKISLNAQKRVTDEFNLNIQEKEFFNFYTQ